MSRFFSFVLISSTTTKNGTNCVCMLVQFVRFVSFRFVCCEKTKDVHSQNRTPSVYSKDKKKVCNSHNKENKSCFRLSVCFSCTITIAVRTACCWANSLVKRISIRFLRTSGNKFYVDDESRWLTKSDRFFGRSADDPLEGQTSRRNFYQKTWWWQSE